MSGTEDDFREMYSDSVIGVLNICVCVCVDTMAI